MRISPDSARLLATSVTVPDLLEEFEDRVTIEGTAVFLFKDVDMAPPALVNNLRHNKVLHDTTLLLAVVTADIPRVGAEERSEVRQLHPSVHQVILRYGFMEDPDLPEALSRIEIQGIPLDPATITYFVGRESVIQGDAVGMHPLFEHLFVLLHRGAASASRFFKLPPDRVFEVGSHVEI